MSNRIRHRGTGSEMMPNGVRNQSIRFEPDHARRQLSRIALNE